MRIGIFTDTYRPTINGITFVADSLKKNLEDKGHEVFIFCPAKTVWTSKIRDGVEEGGRIIRIPSFKSGFFDDFDFTVFFPPKRIRQIKELDLDVIHVLTPSQVGLLGINAALKHDTPLVVQHCTDLYEYIEHYPNVLPGVLALVGVVFPMSVKLNGSEVKEIIKMYRPRFGATQWGRDIISRAITMVYGRADAVISLSRKSHRQLKSWQTKEYNYEITMMPNGINSLPKPTKRQVAEFKKRWNLTSKDEIFGFVGRLAEEKNLPVLIKAMDKIGKVRPNAKLLFVGDFDYREELEVMAAESEFPDRIIFTGAMPRETLGIVYSVLDVFAFPSLKDTQGWVLHEAAHAKKPIVIVDKELSEVVEDGVSGYFARNSAADLSRKIIDLLRSPTKREKFGLEGKKLALKFTEKRQVRKLEKLYEKIIDEKANAAPRDLDLDA